MKHLIHSIPHVFGASALVAVGIAAFALALPTPDAVDIATLTPASLPQQAPQATSADVMEEITALASVGYPTEREAQQAQADVQRLLQSTSPSTPALSEVSQAEDGLYWLDLSIPVEASPSTQLVL